MKILITGGTGFIGKHIVNELKRNIEYCVLQGKTIYSAKRKIF